jgi:hypothetical protein
MSVTAGEPVPVIRSARVLSREAADDDNHWPAHLLCVRQRVPTRGRQRR